MRLSTQLTLTIVGGLRVIAPPASPAYRTAGTATVRGWFNCTAMGSARAIALQR